MSQVSAMDARAVYVMESFYVRASEGETQGWLLNVMVVEFNEDITFSEVGF